MLTYLWLSATMALSVLAFPSYNGLPSGMTDRGLSQGEVHDGLTLKHLKWEQPGENDRKSAKKESISEKDHILILSSY